MTRHLSEGGTVLHRCSLDSEGCMCVYDPECTGKFNRRLVKVPLWLDVICRPRYALRVLAVRRKVR